MFFFVMSRKYTFLLMAYLNFLVFVINKSIFKFRTFFSDYLFLGVQVVHGEQRVEVVCAKPNDVVLFVVDFVLFEGMQVTRAMQIVKGHLNVAVDLKKIKKLNKF